MGVISEKCRVAKAAYLAAIDYCAPTRTELRLLSKIKIVDGCWILHSPNKNGRVSLYDNSKKGTVEATIISYTLYVGKIPKGHKLVHDCGNNLCVNPSHLLALTHKAMMRWFFDKQTHCLNGHPYDKTNTYSYQGKRQCKSCKHDKMVAWWAENKDKDTSHRPKISVAEKRCSGCKETKSIDEFTPDPSRKDGHMYVCRSCLRTYGRERYHKDPKKFYEAAKEYYARHPEQRRASLRKYKDANLDKAVASSGKRRAQKRKAPTEFINAKEVFLRDGGICHICKGLVDPKKWHLDHVVPLSRGGSHTYGNVAVSHPKCNLSKHNKLLSEMEGVVNFGLL